MATNNYTTRTAALRATKADMRQVQVSKQITIGKSGGTTVSEEEIKTKDLTASGEVYADTLSVNVEGAKTNVLDLIEEVKESANQAADNAGIQVTRDLTGNYDNLDEGEVLNVKTKKMNFYGTYVNVVQSETNPDEISIYIGENKNPAEFSTVTAPNGISMYTYKSSGGTYSLGTAPAGTGSTYATCQTAGTETVYAGSSSTVLTIPNKTSKVKVEAVDNSGATIASAETDVIDGTKSTVTASNGGIAINVSNIHLNTPNDAENGMTPGFIRC